jgi:hypothetical protein
VAGALTAADLDRIAAAVDAARTEATRRVYAYTWRQWARWCATRRLSPLPGDPAALCAYLTERAAAGIAISSLDGACTAIRHVHRMHHVPDPVASETVRQVRLGLRRTYGTAPRRLARPLSTADIGLILDAIDRSTGGAREGFEGPDIPVDEDRKVLVPGLRCDPGERYPAEGGGGGVPGAERVGSDPGGVETGVAGTGAKHPGQRVPRQRLKPSRDLGL